MFWCGGVSPEPWNSHEFVEQIARVRGRRIHLSAVPAEVMVDKTCGLWVNADDEDYLLYSEDSPAWHADLVICHELSHMLFEHDLEVTTVHQPAPARQSIAASRLGEPASRWPNRSTSSPSRA